MAIAGLANPSARYPSHIGDTPHATDPSARYPPHATDPAPRDTRRKHTSPHRTDPSSRYDSLLPAASEASAIMPNYERDLLAAKSNISQTEYVYKHRLLFETIRQNNVKRLREKGERVKGIPKKHLRIFVPIEDSSLPPFVSGETHTFIYDTNIPKLKGDQGEDTNTKNSIIEVEDVKLHFMLIPTKCSGPRQVSLSVLEEKTQVEVDACRVRWESLSVRTLPSGRPTQLQVTCPDCLAKGVSISNPYLNIITTTVPRKRLRRRSGKQKDKKRTTCSRLPLTIRFKETPGYQWVTSPSQADIGYCAGQCRPRDLVHNSHAALHFALFRRGVVDKRPCCAPYDYQDFEYLIKNGTKLQLAVWKQAIATKCSCQ